MERGMDGEGQGDSNFLRGRDCVMMNQLLCAIPLAQTEAA